MQNRLLAAILLTVANLGTTWSQQTETDTLFTRQLQKVIVTARMPAVELEPGRTVYHPEASVTQRTGTLYDLLASLPGVTLDADGRVLLYGQTGIRLLIDGKETYLVGEELVALLRGTPATNTDKIEITTQPSARHDAAGSGGMIDIRTKKLRQRGMNLDLNGQYTAGRSGGGQGGFFLNGRSERVNAFRYRRSEEQRLHTDAPDTLQGDMPGHTNLCIAQADLTLPLVKYWKLTTGGKASYARIDNRATYLRPSPTGWQEDGTRGIHYIYQENIHAAYLEAGYEHRGWRLTAGLRMEHTCQWGRFSGNTVQSDSSFGHRNLHLFPNLTLQYGRPSGGGWQLSYTRRITRPNYGDLNPFVYSLLVILFARWMQGRTLDPYDLPVPMVISTLLTEFSYAFLRYWMLLRQNERQQLQLEKVKNDQLVTELKYLKAQYHPHFLFNVLNTVYFQIDEQNEQPRQTLEKLAALLRYQLYNDGGKVKLSTEIEHLKLYIDHAGSPASASKTCVAGWNCFTPATTA